MLAQPGFEPGTSRTLHGSANHYATAQREICQKKLVFIQFCHGKIGISLI